MEKRNKEKSPAGDQDKEKKPSNNIKQECREGDKKRIGQTNTLVVRVISST
jgi:hypothetical protein